MIEYYKKLKSIVLCNGERCCSCDCGCMVNRINPYTLRLDGYACSASLDNGNMKPGFKCPCKDQDEVMATFTLSVNKTSGGA